MLSDVRHNQLRALQRVLTRARSQAYLGLPAETLGRILDEAEYLAGLILCDEDVEAEFRQYLERIERQYAGFDGLVTWYDAGRGASGIIADRSKATVP